MEQEQLKQCSICKEYKEIGEYYKEKRGKYGVRSKCKVCFLEYSRPHSLQYYYENHEDCKRKARERYHRNPEKYHEYYKANREHYREWWRMYYSENKDVLNKKSILWQKNNPEKMKKIWKRNREKHKESRSIHHREYVRLNPDKFKVYNANRRAINMSAEGYHTTRELIDQFISQLGYCFWCDKPLADPFAVGGCNRQTHLDHVIPLTRGGSNWIANLRWTCEFCNQSKKDKLPSEWSGSNGRWVE